MNNYKKFLIALIIIIFSYILWRLIIKRKQILQSIEPFSFNIIPDPARSQLNSLKDSTLKININSLPNAYYNLPLMEVCIKGSYNSAYTGKYITNDMLIYQLTRGCRFFDFEVYYIQNPDSGVYSPQIGYSIDGGFISMDSENSILLDNVLSALVSNAFTSQNSPNNNDPLFINLRIKSNNNDIYKAIATSIDYSIKDKLYKGKLTKNTLMKDLMGKIILCVDKTINYQYKDYTKCPQNSKSCYDLTKYINIESGSEDMNLNRYVNIYNQPNIPLMIKDNNLNTNIKTLNLILPDVLPENAPNPDIKTLIMNYGFQIVPFKFYQTGDELFKYELFFNDNKGGIVPLSIAMMYFKKIEQQNS
jgi:hypothetical protein